MKKYKPLDHNLLLLEAIIKPELYIKDIEKKIDKFLISIHNKNYDLKTLCFKLERQLSGNKILFFPEDSIDKGIELFIRYGINSAATKSDKETSIRFNCNPLLIKIQQNILFANEFKKQFLLVLNHELIHRCQNLAIENSKLLAKVRTEQSKDIKIYLSNKQEIMARAWEIIELFKLQNNFTKNDIIKRIINHNEYRGINTILDSYFNLFEKDSSVIKLLYKYMYLYLEEF